MTAAEAAAAAAEAEAARTSENETGNREEGAKVGGEVEVQLTRAQNSQS